jgi:hypothetical protein
MNQSLDVYWTKIGTFWPWCPRESFIILGSQIVPDNNHVVPCHVIICSGQSRRYCVKLEKVDNIGSTNLIITRGSRLKQKENKCIPGLCFLEFLFGVYAWVSAWGVCVGSLLWVSGLYLCFGFLLGSLLVDLCFQVSALGFCFGPLLRFSLGLSLVGPLLCQVSSPSDLSFGSHVWVSPLGVCFCSMHWVANKGLYFGSLLWSLPEFHFSLGSLLGVSSWDCFFLCLEFALGVSTD